MYAHRKSPASFHSCAGGDAGTVEEFLYLACLHEGTESRRRTSSRSSTPNTAA